MIYITVAVNAPVGSGMAIKETMAMYLDRYGDVKVLSITEEKPQQEVMPGMEVN